MNDPNPLTVAHRYPILSVSIREKAKETAMNQSIKIRTASGKYYVVHAPNGWIERCDMQFTPSDTWRATGMASRHPFCRHFEPHLTTLNAIASGDEDATYKNGKPRYSLVDNDHGTMRIWGEGIVAAWYVPMS
jgi:hypothetical protein